MSFNAFKTNDTFFVAPTYNRDPYKYFVCEKGVFIKPIKTAVKVPVEYNVGEKIYGVTMWILDASMILDVRFVS